MHSIAWWPTLIVLVLAVFTDLRSRRIPNWLVLPFMFAGVAVSGWLHWLAWDRPKSWRSGTWHPAFWNSLLDGRHGHG